jgi:hypothetical protein
MPPLWRARAGDGAVGDIWLHQARHAVGVMNIIAICSSGSEKKNFFIFVAVKNVFPPGWPSVVVGGMKMPNMPYIGGPALDVQCPPVAVHHHHPHPPRRFAFDTNSSIRPFSRSHTCPVQ